MESRGPSRQSKIQNKNDDAMDNPNNNKDDERNDDPFLVCQLKQRIRKDDPHRNDDDDNKITTCARETNDTSAPLFGTFTVNLYREKKSVFWLDMQKNQPNDHFQNIVSCRLILAADGECFYVGGLQILSTAKSVKVYLQLTKHTIRNHIPIDGDNNDDAETYLTTCKGIPIQSSSNSNEENTTDTTTNTTTYYKAMCVIPGGPRPVVAVRLQFEQEVQIQSIRWTVRVPEEKQKQQNQEDHEQPPIPTIQPPQIQQPPMQPSPTPQAVSELTTLFWSFHYQNQRKMDQILSQQQLILQQNKQILTLLQASNVQNQYHHHVQNHDDAGDDASSHPSSPSSIVCTSNEKEEVTTDTRNDNTRNNNNDPQIHGNDETNK
jgi:hypothetical protein